MTEDFKKPKGLKITHLNIRSLWKHLNEIQIFLSGNHIHCATFSETWLTQQMPSSMINIPDYKLYRLDRQTTNATGNTKSGGGLCAYIPNEIHVDEFILKEFSYSDPDLQWLLLVEQISGKIWHNRGFNDKSVKTSKNGHLDLQIK